VSSNTSPAIELELAPTWVVPAALTIWILSIACSVWSVDADPPTWRVLALASLLVGLPALLSLTPGLTPRAIRRVVWLADGTWRLYDGYGWESSARLTKSSQLWGPIAILAWNVGQRRCWAVLSPTIVGASQYRRFCVRWRLQRHA
jgi:hypothetical protein